jgi:hypothetical protein
MRHVTPSPPPHCINPDVIYFWTLLDNIPSLPYTDVRLHMPANPSNHSMTSSHTYALHFGIFYARLRVLLFGFYPPIHNIPYGSSALLCFLATLVLSPLPRPHKKILCACLRRDSLLYAPV